MYNTSVDMGIAPTGTPVGKDDDRHRRYSILKSVIVPVMGIAMIIGAGTFYKTNRLPTFDSSTAATGRPRTRTGRNLREATMTYACSDHCTSRCDGDQPCLFWKKLCNCVDPNETISSTENPKDKGKLVDEANDMSQDPPTTPKPKPMPKPNAKPKPKPKPMPPKRYDAIVIGSGWSGISAARKLTSNGIRDILIIEARDYIGGRSRTTTDFVPGSSMPFELGSEWVYTEWDNAVVNALDRERVAYSEDNSNGWSIFSTDGGRIDDATADDLTSSLWSNGFLRYVEKQSKKIDTNSDNYETMLYQYEADNGITDPFQKQFLELEESSSVVLEYAGDPDRVSVRATMDWLGCTSAGMAVTSVKGGGYSSAVEKIASKAGLDKKISFNSVVTTIDYSGGTDLVTVDYTNADGTSVQATAPAVLVTVPLGVLKEGSIDFVPDLPSYKQRAIANMQFGALDKLIMYWDDDAMNTAPNFSRGWDTVMDSDWLELVTPETDTSGVFTSFFNSRRYNGLNTLTGWVGGSDAEEMEKLSDDELLKVIMPHLKAIFAADVPEPTRFIMTRWANDEYSKGSYSFPSAGQSDTFESLAGDLGASVADKIFFAGEHTSTTGWSATTVGALESGEAAADSMMAVIG